MAMDMMVRVPTDQTETWVLDIDVINGVPTLMDPDNTTRQRAAIAAFMAKGSVPGQESLGVDWAGYNAQQVSLVDVDNQVKKSMQDKVGEPTVTTQLLPIYSTSGGGELSMKLWDISQQQETAT